MTQKIIKAEDRAVLCSEAISYVRKLGYLVSNYRLVSLIVFMFFLLVPSVLAVDPLLLFDLENKTNLAFFFLFLAFAVLLFAFKFFSFAGFIGLILGILYVVNGGNFILGTILLGGSLVISYYGVYGK